MHSLDRRRFLAMMGGLSLVTCSASAEGDNDRQDGFWWEGLDVRLRLGFVMGFVRSAHWGSEQWEVLTQSNKTKTGINIRLSASGELAATNTNFDGIAYGQLVEGMSNFYQDFRNKRITVENGMCYVRDQIRGKSTDKLEQNLNTLRKYAAQS